MEGTAIVTCAGEAPPAGCQAAQISRLSESEPSFDIQGSGASQRRVYSTSTGVHHSTLALLVPPRLSSEGGLDMWRVTRQFFDKALDPASDAKALFIQMALRLVEESEVEVATSDILLTEAMSSVGWNRFAGRLDSSDAGMGYHALSRIFPISALAEWMPTLVDTAALPAVVAEHLAAFNFNNNDWNAFSTALSSWGEATYAKCFEDIEGSDIVDKLAPQFGVGGDGPELVFCNSFVACYFLDIEEGVRESVALEIRLRMLRLQSNCLPLFLPFDIVHWAYYLDDVFEEVQEIIKEFQAKGVDRADYQKAFYTDIGHRPQYFISNWDDFEGYLDLYEEKEMILRTWTNVVPVYGCEREPLTAKESALLDWCDQCDAALFSLSSTGLSAFQGEPIPVLFSDSPQLDRLVQELYESIMESSDVPTTNAVFPELSPTAAANLISQYGVGVRLLAELSALSS